MLQRGTQAEEYGEVVPKQQTHSPNHRSLLCPLELPPVLATALRILSAYVFPKLRVNNTDLREERSDNERKYRLC